MYTPYMPLLLRIEYVLDNFRDGFTFVGCDSGDMRYPHAFTTNSPSPGAACCLFPTLDGIHERWTWELELTVPRTIGDIHKHPTTKRMNGTSNSISGMDGTSITDEDDDLDMVVVCSGDFVDEVKFLAFWRRIFFFFSVCTDFQKETHPTDTSKKIVKFVQPQAVAPQHISIAVGPFEVVNLSEFRDQENEDAMAAIAVDVVGFCLPGRDAELKNTCMFMPKVGPLRCSQDVGC